jgi:hypothetical protein
MESGRGGDGEDVMWGEPELRRVAQAEHGEAVVARGEPEGEHAAGAGSSPMSTVVRGRGFVPT